MGTFPGNCPLLQKESTQDVTDVDISQNRVSEIEVGPLLSRFPLLQRLNLADNQLASLASVVTLGVLPHLEELDVRGNPCCPDPAAAPSRAQLLAALLAPEVSRMPQVTSAAETA